MTFSPQVYPSAKEITRLCGGDWHGTYGNIPGPGHGPKDRGTSVKDNPNGGEPTFNSHHGHDWKAVKDDLRARGILPEYVGSEPENVEKFFKRLIKASSKPKVNPSTTRYDYCDMNGDIVFTKTRTANKQFITSPTGAEQPIPYRLPDIILAREHGDTIWIVEGEKDSDRLASIGLLATCNANGAGKWNDEHSSYLEGLDVVILPDNDEPGRDHALKVAESLHGKAAQITICELPGLSEKGDVSDWLDAGGTHEQLIDLANDAAPFVVEEEAPAETFTATPFEWCDPATIEPRDWIYGRHLIRKYVSVTIAPGGIGKSSLLIAEALAMASGKPLLGQPVTRGPHSVWFYCLEDPEEELQRRVIAAAMQHEITPEDCANRLYVDSGRRQPLVIATETRNGVEINRPCIEAMEQEIKARKIDVLIVDPFVSSHQVSENDNNAIDRVAKEWAALADRTNTAISLVHHTRKLGGGDVTAESSRGGIALVGAARDVRVLNRMTEEEGLAAGVENHRLYFSVGSDKGNMAPPESKRQWHHLESVDLGNFSEDMPSDEVGAVVTWKWPDPFDDVTLDDLKAVQRGIDGKEYRANVQAKRGAGWVGKAVAEHFGWDAESPSVKSKVKGILKTWIANKALKEVSIVDPKSGRDYMIIEVDQWA